MLNCFTESKDKAIPITPVINELFGQWLEKQSDRIKNCVAAHNFNAGPGSRCIMCNADGHVEHVFVGVDHSEDAWSYGDLPKMLPAGNYQIDAKHDDHLSDLIAIVWGFGSYTFTPYKKQQDIEAKLFINSKNDLAHIENTVHAVYLVRDLINTPADDMGPADLDEAVVVIAEEYGAKVKQIVGEDLLKENYPAVHAVGRASVHEPRLIDLHWGDEKNPKVTLVGKGVCFDSGGLDIKPVAGMATMKKDMAGAAHVLALARMIMSSKMPICLRVIIPAVENAISGDAYHPGDVVTTRSGKTIEITNTDAEGRMILCDALTAAVEEKPELLIDFATLTGAATVALGPDISGVFTHHDECADQLLTSAKEVQDPLWRLPIFMPYKKFMESQIADLCNASSVRYGGATTAAIFLSEFIPREIPWIHLDIMAWNTRTLPGRPEGGEASGLRAVFSYLLRRFT